jgi:hypothetical protein
MANHPRVVGEGDLEWSEHSHGENFGSRRKHLGSSAGGEKLGVASTRCCRGLGLGPTTTTSPTKRPSTCWRARHPTYRWKRDRCFSG